VLRRPVLPNLERSSSVSGRAERTISAISILAVASMVAADRGLFDLREAAVAVMQDGCMVWIRGMLFVRTIQNNRR